MKIDPSVGYSRGIDLLQITCHNCSNDLPGVERGKFTEVTVDQQKMLNLIFDNYRETIRESSRPRPSLYLLDSPTGTGKTENFILSQYLTKLLYAS